MDASGSGLEENPLIRLLQEQEKKNIIVRHMDGADDNLSIVSVGRGRRLLVQHTQCKID